VLDAPSEGRIRLKQALEERVRLHGRGDQAEAARRVLAFDELGGK
jgi:hypothetical protein